jgi:hypothetical protein
MRFALHEVLSGMLATTSGDSFSDDHERLAAMFEDLASRYSLFAPMASGVDAGAVANALQVLEEKHYVRHEAGRYSLTAEGRAQCVSSKRTLFNASDRLQLEEAAKSFDTL